MKKCINISYGRLSLVLHGLSMGLGLTSLILSLPNNDFAHLRVPLENILSTTNNFSKENLINTSGFGKEYSGKLLWSGELIDITAWRFNNEKIDREQLFWMEISILGSLKHKNLVSLLGFCDENDEKIIINENDMDRECPSTI
nr:protein kinase-like domain-containing protein [Tanacetum cinerariifolium]